MDVNIGPFEQQLRGLLEAQREPEEVIAQALHILKKAAESACRDGSADAARWYETR